MLRMTFAAALAFVVGCDRDESTKDKPEEAAQTQPIAKPPPAGERTSAPPKWLHAAMERGVLAPVNDDGTYRVDPFIAALVFEELKATGGAPLFTLYNKTGKEGEPEGGYRVGDVTEASLFHRLGLRSGDIVEAIGGVVLTGPDRLGFALDSAENRVTVMVHRDGVSFTNSYRLIGGLAWQRLLEDFTGDEQPASEEPVPEPIDDGGGLAAAGDPAEPSGQGGGAAPASGKPGRGTAPRPGTKPGTRPTTKPSTKPGTRPTGTGGSSKGNVHCESSAKCTVSKSHFDSLVASPGRLQAQAKVVPAIRNDVHSGYKLSSVRPGTTVHQLGFRSGDKVTHVNGRDLTDDAQAMQLYFSLAATRIFKVRYQRGGRSRVKTVVVR